MAITRKPKAPALSPASGVDVDALINKGGSVAMASTAPAAPSDKPVPVVLRVPAEVLNRVDRSVEARAVKVPRHTWLMEAVIEKLAREARTSN
jgi:hypothetical protein